MPVASGSAQTRFGLAGWGVRRAGSFSGKVAAIGLIILQRRSVRPTVTAWVDVSSTPISNTTIQTDAGDTQAAASASYLFRVVNQNAAGRQTAYPSLPLRQDFDGSSVRIAALPNRPVFVHTRSIAAAKMQIRFAYNPIGESGVPSEFRIYEGATLATVDYGTPLVDSVTGLNHIVFDPGAAGYEFTTGVLSESAHVFVVRGRTAAGDEEANTLATAPVTAEATPVSAAAAVSIAPIG